MPKLPGINHKRAIKAFEKAGFYIARESKHVIMTNNRIIIIFWFIPSSPAFAGEDVLNTGDTAWMIVATALVMVMTPAGLALFYGGMSRSKNLLNTFAMTFVS